MKENIGMFIPIRERKHLVCVGEMETENSFSHSAVICLYLLAHCPVWYVILRTSVSPNVAKCQMLNDIACYIPENTETMDESKIRMPSYFQMSLSEEGKLVW